MLIAKSNNDAAFVRRIDAESRLGIWAANNINTPQIVKLGLTHVPGGATDARGQNTILGNCPGIVLQRMIQAPTFELQVNSIGGAVQTHSYPPLLGMEGAVQTHSYPPPMVPLCPPVSPQFVFKALSELIANGGLTIQWRMN